MPFYRGYKNISRAYCMVKPLQTLEIGTLCHHIIKKSEYSCFVPYNNKVKYLNDVRKSNHQPGSSMSVFKW